MKKDTIKIGILAVAAAAGVVTKQLVQKSLTILYNNWSFIKRA